MTVTGLSFFRQPCFIFQFLDHSFGNLQAFGNLFPFGSLFKKCDQFFLQFGAVK